MKIAIPPPRNVGFSESLNIKCQHIAQTDLERFLPFFLPLASVLEIQGGVKAIKGEMDFAGQGSVLQV